MAFISDEELYETLFNMEGIKEKFDKIEAELHTYLDGLKVITTESDPRQVFERLKEKLFDLIPFDDAFVVVFQDNGFVVMREFGGKFFGGKWMESRLFSRIVKGEAVICVDADYIEEFSVFDKSIRENIQSALCVPLVLMDKTAILVLVSNKKHFFTRAHRDILKRFSLLMAQALMNAENFFKLKEAKRIADLDMSMAINLQNSVLTHVVPKSPAWDVAYYFRPMLGISGDIYDFYQNKEGFLEGVSLFDVSGHGVASGLITMMIKTMAFKAFQTYKDTSLGMVFKTVDEELTREVGDTSFYATGVLCRLGDRYVECVNAAHPEILYFQRKSGKFLKVSVKGENVKGFCLGFGEAVSYKSIKFPVEEGDFLVLYSDGLLEGRNARKEEYGLQRLVYTLSLLPREVQGAQNILDAIMKSFWNFVGNQEILHDDLTVLVLFYKGERSL